MALQYNKLFRDENRRKTVVAQYNAPKKEEEEAQDVVDPTIAGLALLREMNE